MRTWFWMVLPEYLVSRGFSYPNQWVVGFSQESNFLDIVSSVTSMNSGISKPSGNLYTSQQLFPWTLDNLKACLLQALHCSEVFRMAVFLLETVKFDHQLSKLWPCGKVSTSYKYLPFRMSIFMRRLHFGTTLILVSWTDSLKVKLFVVRLNSDCRHAWKKWHWAQSSAGAATVQSYW